MIFDMGYMLVALVTGAIGGIIGKVLQSKIKKYGNIPLSAGLTGYEVAKKMLQHYSLNDVQVVEGRGFLSDHYNPKTRTIALSPAIYQGQSIAAAAVAAHECGHAVQHAESYSFLQMRSAIVPVVQFSSRAQQFVLMFAFMGVGAGSAIGNTIMMAAVALFAVTALFSIVTLPVEFDASRRALAWLDDAGITHGKEYDGAKDALKWAAMTYVAAALSAIVMVLYLLARFAGRRN